MKLVNLIHGLELLAGGKVRDTFELLKWSVGAGFLLMVLGLSFW